MQPPLKFPHAEAQRRGGKREEKREKRRADSPFFLSSFASPRLCVRYS
jgi:hypothetical protein